MSAEDPLATPVTGPPAALVNRLAMVLQRQQANLVTAESCTGGLLSTWCTDQPGSSQWFTGGVVSYSNALKHELLGVSTATLAEYGAVSEACAGEMARGAARQLQADLAISTTGVAGPAGGSAAKPVGMVCFGWWWRGQEQTTTRYFTGDRQSIRHQAAGYALAVATAWIEDFAEKS